MLDAPGRLDNWKRVDSLSAELVLGGHFWSMVDLGATKWDPIQFAYFASTARGLSRYRWCGPPWWKISPFPYIPYPKNGYSGAY